MPVNVLVGEMKYKITAETRQRFRTRRKKSSIAFSANFQWIAAIIPCHCEWSNDPVKPCTRAPAVVTKYQKRISGPLLDRIDIHIEGPTVD